MRLIILTVLLAGALSLSAHAAPDAALTAVVEKVAKDAIAQFETEKLKPDEFAITVIDARDPASLRTGSYRGDAPIFPASVVKLFYLAGAHQWLEDGKLQDSAELRRGMRDMIVDSTNDATNFVLEAITDAPGGGLLDDVAMMQWSDKRNAVNRYFAQQGYTGINVCQKTYCEGPYGREKVFIGPKLENRNKLTTDATARLLSEIVFEKAVTPERSKQMMELLHRKISKKTGGDGQASDFTAMALPADARLWSKAGWTSTARHDAAYFELPDGRKMIVVIFTTNHARQQDILPSIARRIIDGTKP